MQNNSYQPNFYLSSAEHRGKWQEVRACRIVNTVCDEASRLYFLVELDPAISGQQYGLGDKMISLWLITERLKFDKITPQISKPIPVLVYSFKDKETINKNLLALKSNDLILESWCEIYPNYKSAKRQKI